MHLVDGSRVVIVGGGPAGSFAALHLLRLAAASSLRLDVVVFEARDFSRAGPAGCNRCAGILSSTLLLNMDDLGLTLPREVVQAEVQAYVLHIADGREVVLSRPDPARRVVSVYRGSGPCRGEAPFPESFDRWLLEQARERGARIVRDRVRTVRAGERPLVVTADESLAADLVVLATGVNSRAPLDPAWGYRPPRTAVMAQDEVPCPQGFDNSRVHVFAGYPPGLVFGALIPKGRYLNISLLGKGLAADAVRDFLDWHRLLRRYPAWATLLCGCTPRAAVSPARNFYADRMVAVGDAAVTRLYKDGIGSAYVTAEAAARAAFTHGVSKGDFSQGYAPVCRRIAHDNRYGRVLIALGLRLGVTHPWMRRLVDPADGAETEQPCHRALWAMFTGDEPYERILRLALACLGPGWLRGVLRVRSDYD